jgi:RNA-directed DNA polymerase
MGKDAFIREEMERLGFWPPSDAVGREFEHDEAELRSLYESLAAVRGDLAGVENEIREIGDTPRLLAEIRRRRIERVRAERAKRREERAREREYRRQQDRHRRQTTLPFLGRGVSGGLRYEGGNAAKVASLGLPALQSAAEIAAAIGITPRDLAFLTFHRGAATVDHYHRFTIPKRRGGTRVISSPKSRLRVAQSWLLQTLLAPLPVHEAAMAFRPARSIQHNAVPHAGKSVVVKIDLKDFFPSVGFGRVKRLFEGFGYNEGVATICALLATEAPRVAATLDGERRFVAVGGRCLPQGACTSPAISNLICRRMDARLAGAAQSLGFAYTRYADDLVFSHGERDAGVGKLLDLVRHIVEDERFVVNEEKTRVMRPHMRQAVTGLVVNESAPRVSREDLRRFRAFLHQFEKQGAAEMSKRIGRDARAYAAGYLSFLHMVSPEQEDRIRRAHPWLERPS